MGNTQISSNTLLLCALAAAELTFIIARIKAFAAVLLQCLKTHL